MKSHLVTVSLTLGVAITILLVAAAATITPTYSTTTSSLSSGGGEQEAVSSMTTTNNASNALLGNLFMIVEFETAGINPIMKHTLRYQL